MSRRAVLQAGAVSALGLGLPQWFAQSAAGAVAPAPGYGRAKACIFLFMWGGPSQLDTLDPKPEAPAEVRGEFQAASTKIAGIQLCEHFQQLATVTDKTAIVRSLTHDDPAHLSSAHATLTGQLAPVVKSDDTPPSRRDTPHIGSVLAATHAVATTGGENQMDGANDMATAIPRFVTMPWKTFHPAAPGGVSPGQDGGWLGAPYDPFLLTGDPNQPNWSIPSLTLRDGISASRFDSRYQLLRRLERQRVAWNDCSPASQLTIHQQKAFDLLGSPAVRKAFDLGRETDAIRDFYGRNIHGQCVLLARRLVEHGVPLVSVNWHNDGQTFWDTHGNNFRRLKNDLIPPADRALAALIADLNQRGLLDETLVVWVGEFGRRPQITAANAGREHWPFCYSGLLAGGGIGGGQLYGASDARAAYPTDDPVSPQDFAATIYHALGIGPDTVLHDQIGRPHRIVQGNAVSALFA
jgi:hypothetical protein